MKKFKLLTVGLAALFAITGTACGKKNKKNQDNDTSNIAKGGISILGDLKTFDEYAWTENESITVLGKFGIDLSDVAGTSAAESIVNVLKQSKLTYTELDNIAGSVSEVVALTKETSFAKIKTDAPKALKGALASIAAIDGDKLGYAINGLLRLVMVGETQYDILEPLDLNKEDVLEISEYFKTSNPALSEQYKSYASYMGLDFPNSDQLAEVVSATNFAYFGRVANLALKSVAKNVTDDDCVAVMTLVNEVESQEAEAFMEEYDTLGLVHRVGNVMEDCYLTADSYDAMKDVILKFAGTDLDFDLGDANNSVEQINAQNELLNKIDNKISGQGVQSVYALATYIVKEVDQDAMNAILPMFGSLDINEIIPPLSKVRDQEDDQMFETIASLAKVLNSALEDLKKVGLYDKLVEFCSDLGINLPALLEQLNKIGTSEEELNKFMEMIYAVPDQVGETFNVQAPAVDYYAYSRCEKFPQNYEFTKNDVSVYMVTTEGSMSSSTQVPPSFYTVELDTSKVGVAKATVTVNMTGFDTAHLEFYVAIAPVVFVPDYMSFTYHETIDETDDILLIETGDYSALSNFKLYIDYTIGVEEGSETIDISNKIKALDTTKFSRGYFDVQLEDGFVAVEYIVYNPQTDLVIKEAKLCNYDFTKINGVQYMVEDEDSDFYIYYYKVIKNTEIELYFYDHDFELPETIEAKTLGVHKGSFKYKGIDINYEYTVLSYAQVDLEDLTLPTELDFLVGEDYEARSFDFRCNFYYQNRYLSYGYFYDYVPTNWQGVSTRTPVANANGSFEVLGHRFEFTYTVTAVN